MKAVRPSGGSCAAAHRVGGAAGYAIAACSAVIACCPESQPSEFGRGTGALNAEVVDDRITEVAERADRWPDISIAYGLSRCEGRQAE